jgi:hypothetical protein
MVRRTLQFALVALVATAVLTVMWNIALGIDEPTVGGVLASYLTWGRWADLAMVGLLAALLVATPLLPGAGRAGHVIAAGAVIAIVEGLINLSRFPEPDVIDLVRSNALPTDLVAGRLTDFSIEATPTYVWAGGVLLMAIGLFILSVDAKDRTWGRTSATLGVAFGVMALTDIYVDTAGVHWIFSWITMAMLFNWLLHALRMTAERDGTATEAKQDAPTSPL